MARTHFLRSRESVDRIIELLNKHWEAAAKKGNAIAVEVTTADRKRTLQQNARLHAVLTDIEEQAWVDGQRFSKLVWKEMFKEWFLPTEEMTLPNGETRLRTMSTADLKVKPFNEFMTQVEHYAVSELGVEWTDHH